MNILFKPKKHVTLFLWGISALGFCVVPISSIAAKPAPPAKVILDHDGAFEDYYNIMVAALLSQQKNPKIQLVAVTTNPVGESYCTGTNRYPKGTFNPDSNDVEVVDFDRSIDGLTQKTLSIAKYNVPIYSGCGESTANLSVDSINFKVELPLGGLADLGTCVQHKELVFAPTELQCYYEFPKRFRDESLLFVNPVADAVIADKANKIKSLSLMNKSMNASDFIAKSMCHSNTDNPLIVFTGGPMTNLGRALQKIDANPGKYGCKQMEDLAAGVTIYHMAGALDTNPGDNLNIDGTYKLRGTTIIDANGAVITQNDIPVETFGNIYWDPISGFDVFAGHHDVYGAFNSTNQHRATPVANGDGTFTVDNNHNVFNALNNAEYNVFIDSYSTDVSLKSGIKSNYVGVNATQYVPLDGFRTTLGNAIASGACTTPAAKFVYGVQSANTPDGNFFGYDTLYLWDTLALTSIFNNFVDYQDKTISVTTRTSGENHTNPFPNDNAAIWPRDAGKIYEDPNGSEAKVGMGVIGDPSAFKQTFQDYIYDVLCSQK